MFSRAKDCHADLHGDSKMEEFKELSHAYSVLSDPAQRSRYDSMSSTDQRGRSGESMNHDQSQVAASMPAVCLISTSVSTCSEMWQWVRRRPLLSTCKNSKAIAKRHWQNQKKKKAPPLTLCLRRNDGWSLRSWSFQAFFSHASRGSSWRDCG